MASLPPWRCTLPIAQLAIFLWALTLGCPYIGAVISEFRQPPDPTGIVFRPQFIDGELSTWEQFAIGANLPPCWLASVVVAIAAQFLPSLSDSGRISELAQHAMQILAIPAFWYWLGSRLDGRTAARRRSDTWTRAPLRALEVIAWIVAIAAVSILLLGSLSGHTAAAPILTCFAAAWFSLSALVLRKLRAPAAP